jgi:DNA-binding transcriptional regulator GbsR (MarR family)
MTSRSEPAPIEEFEGLEPALAEQLGTFELFFKTFGFKRIHGRVWGLLVLSDRALSSKEIAHALSISQGATSTTLNELSEWGALRSEFDPARRCNLHAPIGNTLSIVATVFRRREQVVLGKLRQSTEQTLAYVRERYGPADPRVLTLRSILSSCDIAEAVMQLVFTSVERALGDSESLLSRAVHTALRVGMAVPARLIGRGGRDAAGEVVLDEDALRAALELASNGRHEHDDDDDEEALEAPRSGPEEAP